MGFGARQLLFLMVFWQWTATAQPADHPPFSITISSSQDIWKVGSEIKITIILRNESDRAITIQKAYAEDAGEMFMDVEVKDGQGKSVPKTKYYRVLRREDEYEPTVQPTGEVIQRVLGGGSVHKRLVQPGQILKDGMIISQLYELGRAGKYTLRVERRDLTSKMLVTSNTITVTLTD
jgi:hypothetical protein